MGQEQNIRSFGNIESYATCKEMKNNLDALVLEISELDAFILWGCASVTKSILFSMLHFL
jgi:hypothetical protein